MGKGKWGGTGRIGIERRESVGEWDVLEQREVKNEEKWDKLEKRK